MFHKHTTPATQTHMPYSLTEGNGLAKLNKFNHCDLNRRQSRSDILKCALLLSFPFSINLFLLSLSHLVPVSAEVTLQSHGGAPSVLFPPHYSPFFHICISLLSPSFNVFFSPLCLFLLLFDPCVKSVLGPAKQSPCYYAHRLAAEWRWPLNSWALTFLFFTPLSISLISPKNPTSFHLWAPVLPVVKHSENI